MQTSRSFSSSLGFILSTMGAAVGLGSLWRFPYEVGQHGGGTFLLLYLGFTLLLGFPLILSETAFGYLRKGGTYDAFWGTGWSIIGWMAAIAPWFLASFYNIIIGWILGYMVELCRGNLLTTPSKLAFFQHFTENIPVNACYTSLIILSVGFIVNRGIVKGIERFAKVLMPTFILVLLGLIIYACSLSSARSGLLFYLLPRWSALNLSSIGSALSLAFFSLSIGLGALMTYGAYLKPNSNLPKNAGAVTLGAVTVAFLAGLLIFPFAFQQGIPPNQGASLVFITLPGIFQQLGPYVGNMIGLLFFALLLFAALTTSISLMEVGVNHSMEYSGIPRKTAVWINIVINLLLSIPSLLSAGNYPYWKEFIVLHGVRTSFMDMMGNVVDLLILSGTLLFSCFLFRHWKTYQFSKTLQDMKTPIWLARYVRIISCYVAPILIAVMLVRQIITLF